LYKDQKDVEADLIVDLKTDIEQEKAALEKAVEAEAQEENTQSEQ
jgi:hypothetical protein